MDEDYTTYQDDDEIGPCGNCYDWDYAPSTLHGVPYCMSCGSDAGDSAPVHSGHGNVDHLRAGAVHVRVDLGSGPSQAVAVLVEVQPNGELRATDMRGLQ